MEVTEGGWETSQNCEGHKTGRTFNSNRQRVARRGLVSSPSLLLKDLPVG